MHQPDGHGQCLLRADGGGRCQGESDGTPIIGKAEPQVGERHNEVDVGYPREARGSAWDNYGATAAWLGVGHAGYAWSHGHDGADRDAEAAQQPSLPGNLARVPQGDPDREVLALADVRSVGRGGLKYLPSILRARALCGARVQPAEDLEGRGVTETRSPASPSV